MGYMDYDANDAQMEALQRELDKAGVTKEEFNLDNLAGCTYGELRSTVNAVLKWKQKQIEKQKEVQNV